MVEKRRASSTGARRGSSPAPGMRLRRLSMTSSMEALPLSKTSHNRKDFTTQLELFRKVAGTQRPGLRFPRTHVRDQSCEPLREVVVRKDEAEKLGCSLNRMRITGVEDGSVAHQQGMRGFIGRTITHVNGRKVQSLEDIRDVTSGATELRIRFRDHAAPRGKNTSVPQPESKENHFVSQRRHVRQSQPDEAADLFVPEPGPAKVKMPFGIDTPYGTSQNQLDARPGYVPVLGAPGQPPHIERKGHIAPSPARFRFPPNLSAEQMKIYGLTPGGLPEPRAGREPSPCRRRTVRPRSYSMPAGGAMTNLLAHSSNVVADRADPVRPSVMGSGRPESPSRRKVPRALSLMPKLDFLHHDTGRAVPWSPSSKYNAPESPRAGSPVGRRGLGTSEAAKYNPTFLADPPMSPRTELGRPQTESRNNGDLIGKQWDGNVHQADPRPSIKVTRSKFVFPKVVNRYNGPTRKHPVPTPVVSDIFNNKGYAPQSCLDMDDSLNAHGRGRPSVRRSPLTLSLQPALPQPPRSPSVNRRRSHTPMSSPVPPWGLS